MLCQQLAYLRLGYMLTVLRKVHPQRASMLNAEVFRTKIIKLEQEDRRKQKHSGMDRKSAFAKQAVGTQSIDHVSSLKASAIKRTTDELLLSVTEYIENMTQRILRDGKIWIDRVVDLYRTNLGLSSNIENCALISQSTPSDQLKSVEQY